MSDKMPLGHEYEDFGDGYDSCAVTYCGQPKAAHLPKVVAQYDALSEARERAAGNIFVPTGELRIAKAADKELEEKAREWLLYKFSGIVTSIPSLTALLRDVAEQARRDYVTVCLNDHVTYEAVEQARREEAAEWERAGRLLLDAYGEAHALHDLGECEGSLLMREILRRRPLRVWEP